MLTCSHGIEEVTGTKCVSRCRRHKSHEDLAWVALNLYNFIVPESDIVAASVLLLCQSASL